MEAFFPVAVLVCALTCAGATLAADPAPAPSAAAPAASHVDQTCLITKVEKRVEIQHKGGPWVAAAADMRLEADDQIHTGYKALATLKFADGSEVTVKPMTMIKLSRVEQNGNTVSTKILLRLGEIKANVNDSPTLGSDFQVQTATCTASVRGTRIDRLAYSPALGTTCQMGYEGHLQLQTLRGNVMLAATDLGLAATATAEPAGANATRQANRNTPPPVQLTTAEQQAFNAFGVPKSGVNLQAGSGAATVVVNTTQESLADSLSVNAVNEAASGIDLNRDGVVESVASRPRQPPAVTLPQIPGITSPFPPPALPIIVPPVPGVVVP